MTPPMVGPTWPKYVVPLSVYAALKAIPLITCKSTSMVVCIP